MVPLPNHSHCSYCGNPIPYGEVYCDEDCRELHEIERKMERRKDIIFYAVIAASLVSILSVSILMKMV